jgi:hypothetical protein
VRFGSPKRPDQQSADTETVERVTVLLQSYQRSAGPGAVVSVAHVLDLLNPRGMWSHDPEYHRNPAVHMQQGPATETDPSLDPLTGCKPVTALDHPGGTHGA